ncbi:MAG: hypothetical protein F7C38_05275 [Desulfurococcales archaeon]|nr:hypothetical protein [Desulfurococcales archaeon]
MQGLARDIIVYSVIHTVALLSLALLGEEGIDVYVSVSILTYFIATSILPSIRRYADLRVTDTILIIVFAIVIIVKVASILGINLIGAAG